MIDCSDSRSTRVIWCQFVAGVLVNAAKTDDALRNITKLANTEAMLHLWIESIHHTVYHHT